MEFWRRNAALCKTQGGRSTLPAPWTKIRNASDRDDMILESFTLPVFQPIHKEAIQF